MVQGQQLALSHEALAALDRLPPRERIQVAVVVATQAFSVFVAYVRAPDAVFSLDEESTAILEATHECLIESDAERARTLVPRLARLTDLLACCVDEMSGLRTAVCEAEAAIDALCSLLAALRARAWQESDVVEMGDLAEESALRAAGPYSQTVEACRLAVCALGSSDVVAEALRPPV